MKKIFSVIAVASAVLLSACNNEKKEDKSKAEGGEKIEAPAQETPKATLAAHVCTAECKDGNHLYVHGEEGHTCSEACMKSHSCTEACKDGGHVYAHGEKGHECSSVDCGKM